MLPPNLYVRNILLNCARSNIGDRPLNSYTSNYKSAVLDTVAIRAHIKILYALLNIMVCSFTDHNKLVKIMRNVLNEAYVI